MPPRQKSVFLNKYPKSKKSGSVSIEVKSEPIEHNFDNSALGEGPAEAIRDVVEAQIRGITESASRSTIAKRRRLGISSTRLFNATGKLARGLTVTQDGDEYETRAPRGRLSGETQGLLGKLLELVDISPRDLLKDRKVKRAIEETWGDMVKKKRG